MALVSVHGTGTTLGDPIEVGAIGKAFAQDVERLHPLQLLSNKSHLGHTEGTAGGDSPCPQPLAIGMTNLAGVIKN